jgi:hypothetical protein
MEDSWGSTFSQCHPTGESVNTKEEAEKWVAEADWPGQREYRAIQVWDHQLRE